MISDSSIQRQFLKTEFSYVQVFFTPTQNRDAPYEQIIPVKVNHSSKNYAVNAIGVGHTLKFTLDKALIDLGPIVPLHEGQVPNRSSFSIINPTDYPIEVICMNFDEKFRTEDQLIKEYEGFEGEDSFLYLPPLQPGCDIWEAVRNPQNSNTDELLIEDGQEDVNVRSQVFILLVTCFL